MTEKTLSSSTRRALKSRLHRMFQKDKNKKSILFARISGRAERGFLILNLPHRSEDPTSFSPKFDIASQHFLLPLSCPSVHPSIHSASSFEILADTHAFVWAKSERGTAKVDHCVSCRICIYFAPKRGGFPCLIVSDRIEHIPSDGDRERPCICPRNFRK